MTKDCRETDPWLKIRCHFPDENHSRALRDERNAGPRYSPELYKVPRVKLKVGPCIAPLDMPFLRLPRDFLFYTLPLTLPLNADQKYNIKRSYNYESYHARRLRSGIHV